MLKRILFIAAFALCIVYAKRFCYRHTDGFALNKILSNLSYHSEWEVPVSTQENEVLSLIDQPFHYLAKGAQSYVFVSEDGQTVVKFFRLYHLLPPLWIKMLHFPPKMQLFKLRKMLAKREELEKDFDSYLLAYQQMREETGLLYVHLNKTSHLKQKITLYDRLNIAHTLDLDQMEFLVQKKAELVYPRIDVIAQKEGLESAKSAITNLVRLLNLRCQRGIFDKDPDLNTNFGFIDKTPVQIDIGRFQPDEREQSSAAQREEILRITDHFRQWLDQKYPPLSTHLLHEINGLEERLDPQPDF